MDKLKLIFGFILLGGLIMLILFIGLGHVEEKTSFGLGSLITVYILLADRWAGWAFPKRDDIKKEPDVKN